MELTLRRALESERDTLGRLLEFNAYEFSRLDGRSVGTDGRYGYAYLDAYWSEAGRFPYLIEVDHELAGFALVSVFDGRAHVSEFLVLPKFRRAGVGTEASNQLFSQHPGPWRIDQLDNHEQATAFWRHAIPGPFTEDILPNGRTAQCFTS